MGLSIPINAPTASNGDGEPVDWKLLKKEVLARLDIRKEYQDLGVRLANSYANDSGFIECYAVGRPDDDPDTRASAAIHARIGFYLDKGVSGKSTSFFQFAVDHGPFGSFIEAFRHYADKVGVKVGPLNRRPRGIQEAAYEYTEADGELKYRVLRLIQATGDKTFEQQVWDGDRWVGGKGCMEGVPPLPYRFPELMAADPSSPVLWPEGEKKVDLLLEKGFAATCSHEGGHNFKKTVPHFLDRLPDRDYVLLVDNDPVGRKYAAQVGEALHGRLASLGSDRSVKVVVLPGLFVGGDVVDWFDLGGTPEQLRALVAEAPAWEPEMEAEEPKAKEGDPDLSRNCNLADIRKVMSGVAWTWPFWIANEALTLLAAEAGTGKTRFMMDLHRRAYHGLPWPDGAAMTLPPGGKVLWIAADGQHQELCDIAAEFGLPDESIELATPVADPFGGTQLKTPEDHAEFEARILAAKPYWSVIDTITNTSDYKSHDTADAKKQYEPLQKTALRTHSSIICVTHTNASGTTLGRRANEKVRVVMSLVHPDPGQVNRRKLWVPKSKAVKPPPLGVTMGDKGNEYDSNPPEEVGPGGEGGESKGRVSPRLEAHVAWLVEALGAGSGRQSDLIDQAEDSGLNRTTLFRAAKEHPLIKEYLVDGRKYWRLEFQD